MWVEWNQKVTSLTGEKLNSLPPFLLALIYAEFYVKIFSKCLSAIKKKKTSHENVRNAKWPKSNYEITSIKRRRETKWALRKSLVSRSWNFLQQLHLIKSSGVQIVCSAIELEQLCLRAAACRELKIEFKLKMSLQDRDFCLECACSASLSLEGCFRSHQVTPWITLLWKWFVLKIFRAKRLKLLRYFWYRQQFHSVYFLILLK